jgi:hypothetical protein
MVVIACEKRGDIRVEHLAAAAAHKIRQSLACDQRSKF